VSYAQAPDKISFFSNVTMVSLYRLRYETISGLFGIRGTIPPPVIASRPGNGKTAAQLRVFPGGCYAGLHKMP
jgi:hypothetical protein